MRCLSMYIHHWNRYLDPKIRNIAKVGAKDFNMLMIR
jgi:hypothetical protein